MTRLTWTTDEEAILRRMYPDSNASFDEIVAVLKKPPAIIRTRASRLNLKRPAILRHVVSRRSDREGIATWLASLSGRTASPDAPEGPQGLTEEIGRQWLNDPVAFIQALAPHPLLPYQEEWLRAIATNRYTLLLSSRQIGK